MALSLLISLTPAAARAGGRYVALGDSLAAGVGASDPGSRSYVPLFFGFLKTADGGGLGELRNRGRAAETSGSLRTNGQLASGLADINDPATDTQVVSLDIGGNDACGAGFNDPTCPFASNFSATLDELNGALAADPGSEDLMVMAYYNPATGTNTQQEADSDMALLGTDGGVNCAGTGAQLGLNDLISCVGAGKGAVSVDVYPAFTAGGQAFIGPDALHPNDAGHAAIANDFKNRRSKPPPDGGGTGTGTPTTIDTGPASVPGPPSVPGPSSNRFSVSSARAASDGTATLVLDLPGPGALEALASARVAGGAAASARRVKTLRVARLRRTVTAAGRLRLKIKPSRKAQSILKRKRRLRVSVRITFTPSGGSPNVQTRALTLRRMRRR